MTKDTSPEGLPARLLQDPAMSSACSARDFSKIFELARRRGGFHPSLIARRCELTPSRVGEISTGRRQVRDMAVVERVADGLRIPGRMLGLSPRSWESGGDVGPPVIAAASTAPAVPTAEPVFADVTDPELVVALIEEQLPQLYRGANFFGAAQSVHTVTHHAQCLNRLLEVAEGEMRQTLLQVGGRVAEFLGWLCQDLGDYRAASYWSDRSMEWAQEAADDHMQAYVLFRKSHQAAARSHAHRAVGLARAAQRIENLTPPLKALAAQQEAVAYALQRNPKAALGKFDEACSLASKSPEGTGESALDVSYCTPTYIEIQRANCWTELGSPKRAVRVFEEQLAELPPVYRNDRSVYLARLARACLAAGEHERGMEAADQALTIAAQTGSARILAELAAFTKTAETQQGFAGTDFVERYEAAHRQLTPTTAPQRWDG